MKYISILRGINVSGQKKIKMGDLKVLYEQLGFENVVTYIQSGNVIFETNENNTAGLTAKIKQVIQDEYTFHVPVVIRTHDEIKAIIKNCPFSSINLKGDGTKVLLTFLSSEPIENKISDIQQYVRLPEKLVVSGKNVYLHCPNGYGRSKLSNNFLEKKLAVRATTRNWKTVHKLHELSS